MGLLVRGPKVEGGAPKDEGVESSNAIVQIGGSRGSAYYEIWTEVLNKGLLLGSLVKWQHL